MLKRRTKVERAAFDAALARMHLWYAHQKLFAILLNPLPDGCSALPCNSAGTRTLVSLPLLPLVDQSASLCYR